MIRRVRSEKGQAAVETVFSIPVMLILFLIGAQLYSITWNAQYVHVVSRYKVIAANKDRGACYVNYGPKADTSEQVATATVKTDTGLLLGAGTTRTLKQKAKIFCPNISP